MLPRMFEPEKDVTIAVVRDPDWMPPYILSRTLQSFLPVADFASPTILQERL